MATKRPDKGHDSTMELSVSQLVVPKRVPMPPRGAPPKGAQNDMSTWGQVVVGTSDFAPAPVAKSSSKKWIVAVVLLAVAGVGGYFVVSTFTGDKPAPSANTATSSSPSGSAAAAAPATGSASETATAGSGSATGSGSAAAAGSAAGSAATPTIATPTITTPEVDAISGVAPVIKPKKKTVAKAVVKKTAKKAPPKKTASKKTAPKKTAPKR